MAANTLVDAGFLVALLNRRDSHHRWAVDQAGRYPPPWLTCEAVISEAVHLLGQGRLSGFAALFQRQAIACPFHLAEHQDAILRLLEKYSGVPMSFADACLVRMTETVNDPVLLTTDADFRVYRRHGRQVVPCVLPT